jgi:hypothetical protein
MAIAVEDNGHTRVTGSRRDLLWVRFRCDPQRDGGVAQVVHAERGEISLVDGWVPEAAAEAGGADGMTLGRCEDQVARVRWRGRNPGELLDYEARHGHRSERGPRLRWAEAEPASQVGERLRHGHLTSEHVDVLPPQSKELTDAETAVAGEQHEGPVPLIDCAGEAPELLGCQESHFLAFDLRDR